MEARALRSALGQLPRVYLRLQRIFGAVGPNALKLAQVGGRLGAVQASLGFGRQPILCCATQ